MALHNHLPVYKASYDFMVHVFEQIRHFSRDYKFTLGQRLQNETIDLLTHIYRANSHEQKAAILQKAMANVEVIRLFLRLSKDLKLVNIPHFADLNEKLENISKQLSGWHKHQVNKESSARIANG